MSKVHLYLEKNFPKLFISLMFFFAKNCQFNFVNTLYEHCFCFSELPLLTLFQFQLFVFQVAQLGDSVVIFSSGAFNFCWSQEQRRSQGGAVGYLFCKMPRYRSTKIWLKNYFTIKEKSILKMERQIRQCIKIRVLFLPFSSHVFDNCKLA